MMGTKVAVNFNGFSGYYGVMTYYDGYKGFDYSDIDYFTRSGVDAYFPKEHTGYNNDLHGSGEAFTASPASSTVYASYGFLSSPNKETFTLRSGDFASGTDSSQQVYFIAFKGAAEKAEIKVVMSCYHVTHIDFAHYGSDFRNITQVEIYGSYKNAVGSSYGIGGKSPVVLDNLKITWNGSIPPDRHAHVADAVLGALHAHTMAGRESHADTPPPAHDEFHSVLTHFDSALAHAGGLTSEFLLSN